MNILIIDDAPMIHKSIQRALKHSELRLHHAYDGKEGLRLFYEVQPVVTIVDLKMPTMDGIEVIKEIKPLELLWQKIIVLTGHGEDDEILECYGLGVYNFMKKPFNVFALRGLIQGAIFQMEKYKRLSEQQEKMMLQKLSLAYQISVVEMSTKFIHKLGNLIVPLSVGSQMLTENLSTFLKLVEISHRLDEKDSSEENKKLSDFRAILKELYHDYQENTEMIEETLLHIMDMIDAQQRYWKPKNFDMSNVFVDEKIMNIKKLVTDLLFHSGISIETDFDPELDEIRTIRLYFIQAVYNLLLNSVEATSLHNQEDNHEGKIVIKTTKIDENHFSLSIKDSSGAISAERLAQAREADFTPKEHQKDNGLYFVHLFVEYANGKLEVFSEMPEQETRIVVTLPIYQKADILL